MNEEMSALSDVHSIGAEESSAAAQHANSSNAYGTFAGGDKEDDTEEVASTRDDWSKIREDYAQSNGGMAVIKRLPPYFCWVFGGVVLTILVIVAITLYATSSSGSSPSQAEIVHAPISNAAKGKQAAPANQAPPLTAAQKSEVQKMAQQQVGSACPKKNRCVFSRSTRVSICVCKLFSIQWFTLPQRKSSLGLALLCL
jgi:hypothetical protein